MATKEQILQRMFYCYHGNEKKDIDQSDTAVSRERLSDKRFKPTCQARMLVWVFIGILHIGADEIHN